MCTNYSSILLKVCYPHSPSNNPNETIPLLLVMLLSTIAQSKGQVKICGLYQCLLFQLWYFQRVLSTLSPPTIQIKLLYPYFSSCSCLLKRSPKAMSKYMDCIIVYCFCYGIFNVCHLDSPSNNLNETKLLFPYFSSCS